MRARLLNPFCANPIKFIKCQHINTRNPFDQSQLACHIHFITGWLLTSCDDLNTQSQSPDSSPKQALIKAINISTSPDNLANNECEHEKSSSGASESDPERISNLPKHFATATRASPPSKPPANKRETPCVWLGCCTMTPTIETIPKISLYWTANGYQNRYIPSCIIEFLRQRMAEASESMVETRPTLTSPDYLSTFLISNRRSPQHSWITHPTHAETT